MNLSRRLNHGISVFGGGGGGGGGPAPDTTTQFIREAPGIEERKLELMDLSSSNSTNSYFSIPDIQYSRQLSPLEQAAITQAGQTGVGAGAVGQAITGTQAAMGAPNISQFYNPYQSYVLDEINRQAADETTINLQIKQWVSGAFGGGRQGIQAAEVTKRNDWRSIRKSTTTRIQYCIYKQLNNNKRQKEQVLHN
jgi:hypothetical protein